jgi:outer membrane immunogenic protein
MQKLFVAASTIAALISAPAMAADMPLKAPPQPIVTCNWCGFYIGANAGYAWSHDSMTTTSTPTPDAALGVVPGVTEGIAALSAGAVPIGHSNGFIGGVQAGYNWQTGNFLAGLEADIQGLSHSGGGGAITQTVVVVGTPVTSTQAGAASVSYLGTLRGRLGIVANPNWLLYVTGGLAYGGVKANDSIVQTGTNGFSGAGFGSLSTTRAGWALGAGTEWMFAPKWSVKAEYLHYDLGTASFGSAPAGTPASTFFVGAPYQTNVTSVRFQGDMVRVGLNYHL